MKQDSNNKLKEQTTWWQRTQWRCAAADLSTLVWCEADWRKQSIIGTMVLVTATMAFISGACYLHTLGMATLWAVTGASFWAFIIFCIDYAMLAFWQKGADEWKRLIPRLVLSTLIWMTIGKAMFAAAMSGEINREIKNETDAAVVQIQTNSIYQAEKNKIQTKLDNDNIALASLQKDVTDAEKERDNELGGVRVDGRTTGVLGDGPEHKIKEQLVERAKERLESEGGRLQTEINQLTTDLKNSQTKIDKEVSDRRATEVEADGPERRLQIMLKLMVTNPLSAAVWFLIALLLLVIETLPVLLKFFAEESDYDRLSQARITLNKAFNKRLLQVITAVETGRVSGLKKGEAALVERVQETFVTRMGRVLDVVEANTNAGRKTRIGFSAPPHSKERYDVYLTDNELTTIGLEDLFPQIDGFIDDISESSETELSLMRATSSGGVTIRYDLPLLPQLNPDRLVFLDLAASNQRAGEVNDLGAAVQ